MIIFFGPAGAGKSVQGQILAARNGWRWLSIGQILRDTRDESMLRQMQAGKLIDSNRVNQVMAEAINRSIGISKVVLDGFPRSLDQAEWMIENQDIFGRTIDLVVVLDVTKDEIIKRLELRGRADDTPQAIDERLSIYRQEIDPILNYFGEKNIKIVHIDGIGTVGQVHDRIMEELEKCKLA